MDAIFDMKNNLSLLCMPQKIPQFSDDDHDDHARFELEEPQRWRRQYELLFTLSFLEDLVKRIYRLVFWKKRKRERIFYLA